MPAATHDRAMQFLRCVAAQRTAMLCSAAVEVICTTGRSFVIRRDRGFRTIVMSGPRHAAAAASLAIELVEQPEHIEITRLV